MSIAPDILPQRRGVSGEAVPPAAANPNVGPIDRGVSLALGGALALFGLSRRNLVGGTLALVGGALITHGARGHSILYDALGLNTASGGGSPAPRLAESITIGRPREEAYLAWRDPRNLPRFMRDVERVEPLDGPQGRRMRWIARYPGLGRVEWEAELTSDEPGQRIAWRSLPNSPLQHEGEVRFLPAAGGRGTEVHELLRFAVPGGGLGRLLGRAASGLPAMRVKDDLRRFKALLEAGEIATTAGQPSGRERKD